MKKLKFSSPVVVTSVKLGKDRVLVRCADGSVRSCVASTLSAFLGRRVTVASIAARCLAFVGRRVVFAASDGWSPRRFFVWALVVPEYGEENPGVYFGDRYARVSPVDIFTGKWKVHSERLPDSVMEFDTPQEAAVCAALCLFQP